MTAATRSSSPNDSTAADQTVNFSQARFAFRQLETGPAFMVVDALDRPIGTSFLVGEALSREQVVDEPIAKTVFAVCDSILLHDARLFPLREKGA